MRNSRTINVVAVATTLAAWVGLHAYLHPGPPAMDRKPHEALGEVLAAEALARLKPGARLLVIARDPEPYQVPASAAQLESFESAILRGGGQIAGCHWIKLDPLRLPAVPPGDFFDLIRRGREDDVIVSFIGPPVLEMDQVSMLGTRRPQVLAVCTGEMPAQVDLVRIFDQHLLAVAVIDRTPPSGPAASGGTRAEFDRRFRLVTGSDLAEPARQVSARD